MTKEKSEQMLDKLKIIYIDVNSQLKNYKQLEISLKGASLKKKGHRYALLPDHDKGMHYINDDIIVGIVDLDTQEKLYFDEPVFSVNSITISEPKKVRDMFMSNKSVAEQYLFNKSNERRKNGETER